MKNLLFIFISFVLFCCVGLIHAGEVQVGPKEGSKLEDFSGTTMHGDSFQFSKLVDKGSVVIVMLRGFPGYQCPVCSTQVAGYVAKADEFKKQRNTPVVFIYPGKVSNLEKRAQEFTAPLEKEVDLPNNIIFVIDHDYKITNHLGLRWDAPKETAYPAAFVIDHSGYVQYAKVSDNHQDRATADEVLEFLDIIH
ncbi:MAG: redoxin family protein [Gammaproteobacteria bacterium]|nr:MAG: redoxin family protein [Gammaproteobacteria bacterium]